MAIVAESDSAVELCVAMTTTPPGATLGKKVDLLLSTINGTGKVSKIPIVVHTVAIYL